MAKTNPNGANQYILDPRQDKCWGFYIDPKSETFGNAYQSALKAGYKDSTATLITTTDWFIEKLRRLNMLSKAEKKLDEILDLKPDDTGVLRIQADIAKFVASTQGRNEGYSSKTETDVNVSGGLDLITLLRKADDEQK